MFWRAETAQIPRLLTGHLFHVGAAEQLFSLASRA
jgi:hypothetical protein